MCDSTHSKRHCRVTSLSEDVIYKDVCTVGGFSCKFTALHWAMSQHERHVWETADEAKFFISFIHLWGRNVEWKKLRCLWKFPKTVKCEWEESAQGNCFWWRIILSVWIGYLARYYYVQNRKVKCGSFIHHARAAKILCTPQLQVISLTLTPLLFLDGAW